MVRRRLRRAGLLLALGLVCMAFASADEQLVLGVTINQTDDNLSAVFVKRDGHLWARRDDLDAWRITHDRAATATIDDNIYVDLSGIEGLKTKIDETSQTVAITVPVERFVPQSFQANVDKVPSLSRAIPALYLNYDVAAEGSSQYQDVRGFFEVGASNHLGVASTSFTAGATTKTDAVAKPRSVIRLDSYLLRDNPETATRLTVGDAITAGSGWSRPIHFGGVKYGTDYTLRPGYITFPTADFQGRTVLPSSVEFYANGALRYRRDVDRGPFAVDQAPLPSGAGQLTIVTRDLLGVERRTTTPYYVSTNLLREGLTRYSVEAGAERDNYGTESFDYSRPFVAGTLRHGFTNRVTLEWRGEFGSHVQSLGATATTALPVLGEFSGTVAASNTADSAGLLWGASYSRVSEAWDAGLSFQQTTSHFSQLGIRRPEERIRRQVQGNAGRTFGRYGRLSFSIAELKTADGNETRVGSASYSVNVGTFGYLDAFAVVSDSQEGRGSSGVGIGLTIPFGPRTTGRTGAEVQNGKVALTADYRVSPPTDRGFGYGGEVRLGAFSQQRADATYVGDSGEFRVDAARVDGASGLRGTARGSLVVAENSAFFTRQIVGAFGIVDANGYSGVRVYQDNRPLTRTNARGLAIIPGLRPYEENAIRLSPEDMPIGARVDADDILLVPAYRTGATAHFKVKTGHPATVLIAPPGADEIPAGTAVSIDDGRERTFIGYDGSVFVSDARPTMTLDVDLPGGGCRATATLPSQKMDLPQVGPVKCIPKVGAK